MPRARWIKAVPYELPPRFDPSVEDSEHLAAHRELILSAFDPADFAPFKITRAGARLAAFGRKWYNICKR